MLGRPQTGGGGQMKRGGGKRRGCDMAEKLPFPNFFWWFRASGTSDHGFFYHTNFSRRIHPWHPEFLPRGWERKADLLTLILG